MTDQPASRLSVVSAAVIIEELAHAWESAGHGGHEVVRAMRVLVAAVQPSSLRSMTTDKDGWLTDSGMLLDGYLRQFEDAAERERAGIWAILRIPLGDAGLLRRAVNDLMARHDAPSTTASLPSTGGAA
jgi:hypothetical protein